MNAVHNAIYIRYSQNIAKYGYTILMYLLKKQNWYEVHFSVEPNTRWNGAYFQQD